MSNQFLDAIQQGAEDGKPLLWIEAEAYGAQVVRNGKPFPWTNPTEFVSSYGQLQSLLKPDVAPLNLGNFLTAWLQANPAALGEISGKKRIRFAIKKLLGMDAPRVLIRETVSALCQSVSQPLVLVLPPNGELINWANEAANGGGRAEITEIDVDSVSVYLADMLRTFSGLDVAGVMVQLPEGSAVNDELLELYSPIINVAKHYHWAFGMQVSGASELSDSEDKINFVVADRGDHQLACPNGQVLDQTFWEDGQAGAAENGFYFTQVPESLTPELVLSRLQELR